MMTNQLFLSIAASCMVVAHCVAATEAQEGDAFARADGETHRWTIGTAAVQMTYACADGQLRMEHFQNRLSTPVREYASPSLPFGVEALPTGAFAFENLWSKALTP